MGLFFWNFYSSSLNFALPSLLIVTLPAVILAGIIALVSLVTYIWLPIKFINPASIVIYMLFVATTILLVITNGVLSPFISLWVLLSLFGGFFGLWGSLSILLITCIFIANQYMGNFLSNEVFAIIVSSSFIPVILGLIIWHARSNSDDSYKDDQAYRNLANELSEVANKSEVVINAIDDGVIAIDSQGIIQLINPAAQRIIGWGKQDALALNYKTILQLVDQKDNPLDEANDPIQQVLNISQHLRTNDLVLVTNSGKKLMISLVVSPAGEIGSGVIAVFHDITKEKSEERGQAEFISTASHEMRTPVAAIEGYLGLAMNPQTAQIDEKARYYIQKAHESAEHLGHLFQDLLDVSKADDKRLSNNPKIVDVVAFTHEIVQGLRQKAANKGIQLNYIPIPDNDKVVHIAPVCYVNLDNDHIREVINNLVENAIKYTLTGQVSVDVNGDDEHVTISIQDTGIGIPIEDMSHLFQKFYRVDNKDTREIGGTGLGLYLCRRLVEIMGGRIWAESIHSKGSTFFVELPRTSSLEVNKLIEQEKIKAQQEIDKKDKETPVFILEKAPETTPIQPTQPIQIVQAPQTVTPASSVPRSNSLTPEQIAAYVAKQRSLIQQQNSQPPTPQLQTEEKVQ